MSTEANKAIVRRYHHGLWSGDFTVIDELLPSGYNSGMGQPEEIKASVVGALAIVPDLKLVIHELIGEGDKVVTRWTMSGTNQGPARLPDGTPLPPPGQPYSYTGITINQVVDGKIVSDVFENSWHEMLLRMGVTLP